MKTLNFTNPQGQILTVNSPDDSIPSEGELDQMFAQKYGKPSQSQPTPSIATQGASYITQHPYKTFFDPAAKTLTGTSLLEKSQSSPVFSNPPSNPLELLGEYGAGLTRDVGAMGADIATTPFSIAGSALMATKPIQMAGKALAGSPVGQVVGKVLNTDIKDVGNIIKQPFNKVGEVFQAGKNLKNVQSQIGTIENQLSDIPKSILNIRNEIRATQYGKNSNLAQKTDIFNKGNQILNQTLKKDSILQSKINKQKLQSLFKDMSTTYKEGLDQAENSLIEKGVTITPKSYINDVIEPTLNDLRLKGLPADNQQFNEILKLKNSLENQYSNQPMSLNDLKNLKNNVYDSLSSGVQSGSKYATANDQVANIFLKNHGDFVGQMSPELKQLNKEFSPMVNARTWAMKTFKPYNDNEIQKGANILQRLAKNEIPDQTDLNYLKQLEVGSGRFSGIGDLKGNLLNTGKTIRNNKEIFDATKKSLIDSADFKINQLQNKIADIQSNKITLGHQRENLQIASKRLENMIKVRNRIILTTAAIAGIKATGIGKDAIQGILNH